MNKATIKNLLSQWQMIAAMTVIFALIAFIVSVILPAKYQSDISMIVVQKQATEKVDAFSATKSAEFLSNIFTQAIYTTSFFNAVQEAPFEVKRDFSRDPEEREKEWDKLISVRKVNNTGIIHISVFEPSRSTAENTAKAIAYVLTTQGENYHGGGERVEVRLIDGPNTPLRPTVPRMLPNTIAGGAFGGLVAVIYVHFFGYNFRKKTENIVLKEENQESQKDDIVATHFENVEGTIVLDEEVDELHKRISNFHEDNAK